MPKKPLTLVEAIRDAAKELAVLCDDMRNIRRHYGAQCTPSAATVLMIVQSCLEGCTTSVYHCLSLIEEAAKLEPPKGE